MIYKESENLWICNKKERLVQKRKITIMKKNVQTIVMEMENA